jgi:methionyl aminopeptidase
VRSLINIKTPQQIEGIKAASKVVAIAHNRVRQEIRPGLSTYQVDNVVKHTLQKQGAESAFYRYSQAKKPKFPGRSCISINEEVVHGIPSHTRFLKEGDTITIDVGAILNGFYGDAAITLILGQGTSEAQKLVDTTKQALDRAISLTAPEVWLYDISQAIFDIATNNGYGVVKDYYGHGVGLQLHEAPQIPNFRPAPGKGSNVKLRSGMIVTYEPMFTLGSGETEELPDEWTVVTKDHSIAAHWEHTILVTNTGAEILTI